jgi:uroporphyrinogen III methyltransferase/synthase
LSGKAYLVGAGPGDPGLITVRGMDCLRNAEVVLYDDLTHPDLVDEVLASCERIYVGKRSGFKSKTQEETNDLIIDRVRQGMQTVRLKGGDPYVFGRGGEEALALIDAELPFEVVPGVTSGFAAPAYAGIPVTHRGVSTQVTLVTGHEDPTKPDAQVDWEALGKVGGTIVVYMGIGKRKLYADRLIAGGLHGDTPVAAIQWGTRPEQKSVRGTLATLHELDVANPAAIVIGQVAGMHLDWFTSRPLAGKTIVVTRTRDQASEMVRLLRDAGAEVLEIPTIEICDPESWDTVDKAIDNVASFQWLAFASPNSVDRFITRFLKRRGDIRVLSGIKIATIGPATTKRVEAYYLCADVTPENHLAEGLAAALIEETSAADRVLYPRAEGGRDVVPDALSESGIEVVDVVVYRTTKPSTTPQVAIDRFREVRVDLVTFTSSSTVRHFDELMADAGLSDEAKCIPSASIGPTTSATIEDLGYNLAVQSPADDISVDALVTEILKYVSK